MTEPSPELPTPPDASVAEPSAEDEWQHFHPLSPLLRGGVAFLAVLGYIISQQFDRIFGAQQGEDPTGGHPLLALAGTAGVLTLIVGGAWLSWRVSRFRVSGSLLELRGGLLFRQHRQVHFDRIQAVDVVRPLLARLVGVSEVVVQAAGGRDSNLRLAFLGDARAHQLRDELMALAGHGDEVSTAQPGLQGLPAVYGAETPGIGPGGAVGIGYEPAPLVRVPNARQLQAALYSGATVFLLCAIPVVIFAIVRGVPGILGWLGPMTIGVFGRHIGGLVRNANFELIHRGDGLRVKHGLTELRATSVPLHRIQAVELRQPVMWRLPGWWRLRVNVAGVGGADQDTETLLLPVGTLDEALAVLGLVRPGLEPGLAVEAMTGDGSAPGFVGASRRARLLDPISWRRRGYAVSREALVLRGGRLLRVAQFVPHARIQSLRLDQGLVQRRSGVASVSLVSTPGPVKPQVSHLDTADAMTLINEQIARSSAARTAAAR